MKSALLAALLLVATPAAAACPTAGLAQKAVTLVTANGKFVYTLDVALSAAEQQCGLMFRTAVPQNAGMVFRFGKHRSASLWMENTAVPLDLIFVGRHRRVRGIASGKPLSRDLIDSGGDVAAVIALAAGEATRIGLKLGDKVKS
jgi:uncharacterized membrane protein (UPF0127 family)